MLFSGGRADHRRDGVARSRSFSEPLPMDPIRAQRYEQIFAGFMALFVTFVLLTNTVGVKLFTLGGVTLPVSIIWYPLTFLITDIVSEVYGARRARFLVITGFTMSLVLLAFSLIGIGLPVAASYRLQEDYTNIFGPVRRLLFASMSAYLLAQLVDVQLFHFWKRLTHGRHLWLRNNASTMVSQLVDSVVVNVIFLYKNPLVFTGTTGDLARIILAVYVVKVAIAAADTPLCYLGVSLVSRATGLNTRRQL
jgi:uncharacterized integral membrane protein (TIGR00697 family)